MVVNFEIETEGRIQFEEDKPRQLYDHLVYTQWGVQ